MKYIWNMKWFWMAMMHIKLIRMKCGMLWNILKIAGVHQVQVKGLHQVHGVVQDNFFSLTHVSFEHVGEDGNILYADDINTWAAAAMVEEVASILTTRAARMTRFAS
jgi:hypothetical protein